MRICFVSHSAGRYGGEIALLELLQGLIRLNVECLVFVPRRGPLLIELDRLQIPWKIISYPPWLSRRTSIPHRIGRTLKTLVMGLQMARVIADWRCDVVYTNTVCIGVGAYAAWLARKCHVWHSHESGYYSLEEKFDLGHYWTTQLMNRLSAHIIVVSRSLEDDYARYIKRDKMRLIYQSVTISDEIEKVYELACDSQLFQCVIIGSVQPWKGQEEAINALSEVVRRGINAHLLIIGDGPKRFQAALHQQVEDHGLAPRVKFIGYSKNPMQFIHMANVVLMCSRGEAFGRVTIETMLAGKPLIGTASGATVELIKDGKTGLLYESGNHIQLADKIQYLYENPKKGSEIAAAARIWAAGRFTQERYAKEVFILLNEVLTMEKTSTQHPSN